MEHSEAVAQQPEANVVPQEANEKTEAPIKSKWWYYQNSYKLAMKRRILSSYKIGDVSRANGKLIDGLALPKTLYFSMLGLTSSGKSSLSNTLLQHQESDTTTPPSVAAVGDGTSGVKTLTLGQYPCLDSKVMLVDTRGFNTSEFTQDDGDEVTKIGTGTLDNVRGQIYRKNDERAAVTIVDSSAQDYSLIHLPIVVMAANASNDQQAVVTSMIDKVRQLGFAHILLVITKKSLNPVRAEEIKQNGFATIPKKDIYLIDNYPPDDVKEGTPEYLQFLRKQEEQAVDIMLACITLAEFNGLYNVPVIDTRALVKKYYEKLTHKAKAYDLKFSLSSVFLSVLLFSVLYLLRKLVL